MKTTLTQGITDYVYINENVLDAKEKLVIAFLEEWNASQNKTNRLLDRISKSLDILNEAIVNLNDRVHYIIQNTKGIM